MIILPEIRQAILHKLTRICNRGCLQATAWVLDLQVSAHTGMSSYYFSPVLVYNMDGLKVTRILHPARPGLPYRDDSEEDGATKAS